MELPWSSDNSNRAKAAVAGTGYWCPIEIIPRESKSTLSVQDVSCWYTHRGVGHCSCWAAPWVLAAPQPGSLLCSWTVQAGRTHGLCSTCSALPSALLWTCAPSSQIKVIPLPLYYFSLWILCDNTMWFSIKSLSIGTSKALISMVWHLS